MFGFRSISAKVRIAEQTHVEYKTLGTAQYIKSAVESGLWLELHGHVFSQHRATSVCSGNFFADKFVFIAATDIGIAQKVHRITRFRKNYSHNLSY